MERNAETFATNHTSVDASNVLFLRMSQRFTSFSMPISFKYGSVFLNIWWMPLRIAPFWASQGFKQIKRIKKIKKTPHTPERWLGVRGWGGVRVCPSLPALGKEWRAHHHAITAQHAQSAPREGWCFLNFFNSFNFFKALWSSKWRDS